MAGTSENDDERTEAATVFRREELRRQGSVALSRELVGVSIIFGVIVAMFTTMPTYFSHFGVLAERFFTIPKAWDMDKTRLIQLGADAVSGLAWMAFPVLGAAVVVAIVTCMVQVGWTVSWEPLSPKWDRLNPVNGFKRIFSSRGLVEAVKAILKLSLGFLVLWWFIRRQAEGLSLYYSKTTQESTLLTLKSVFEFVLSCLGVFLIPSGLDYVFQRFSLERQMRMTRREAKDELKLREGDPLIKARIKSVQRRMATRRMMESVPLADVVVTNPTHFAVALKYDAKKMMAPKVVAKGVDLIAEKIREIARSHGVPIVENRPLARALYRKIEINQYIPRELYKAVAEVLSYVYRLRGVHQAGVNG